VKKNRSSTKANESVESLDKEILDTVSQPNNDADVGLAPVAIMSETSAEKTVTSVHSSETTVPVVSVELNSETSNLLSTSNLTCLGKDGLSSALLSVIENSIDASGTATLPADGPDLMRTLSTDEERVIQELVQVSKSAVYYRPENVVRQLQTTLWPVRYTKIIFVTASIKRSHLL